MLQPIMPVDSGPLVTYTLYWKLLLSAVSAGPDSTPVAAQQGEGLSTVHPAIVLMLPPKVPHIAGKILFNICAYLK